jgi:hypothetical protein
VEAEDLAGFLDACRKKRNIATYESVGMISPGEVAELLKATARLDAMVREWLEREHPNLV